MKFPPLSVAVAALLLSVVAEAQNIPAGTVLPVMLNSTLDVRRSQPGQTITGAIKQDVPLPDGSAIPKGSRLIGQVVGVTPAAAGSPSRLLMKFDRVVVKRGQIPITAHLRALASMNAVFEARLPTNSWADYGTSTSDWNTVQVGGAGVFRGNGQVIDYGEVVGRATDYGAVTAKLLPALKSGCTGDDREQALWVFSPSACGVYGFADLRIVTAGKPDPAGVIEFESPRDIRIQGGSGWLLQVDSVGTDAPAKN